MNFLKQVYYQPSLTEKDYEEISAAHEKLHFQKNSLLLREGKIAREYYVIEQGVCRTFLYGYNGEDVTTEFYCSGELLIESFSLFHKMPSRENVQALTDVTVWKMEYDVFEELLNNLEGLREWGRTWATARLFALKQRSINMFTMNAGERYAHLLKERPEVVQQAPVKQMASYLGITDTSLSRIRKALAKAEN